MERPKGQYAPMKWPEFSIVQAERAMKAAPADGRVSGNSMRMERPETGSAQAERLGEAAVRQ